jgi:hypothetical protein
MKQQTLAFALGLGGILEMTTSRATALGCILMFAGLAASGTPIVIVSNLAAPPAGLDIGGLNAGAQSFTTGGTAATLQDIELDLLGSGGAVDVSLFSDNSGLPGSSLLSLGTLTPTGSGYGDYNATGTYALAADSTYWVVVDYLGTPSWGWTDSTAYIGTGTLGTLTNSYDGGTTWNPAFPPTPPYPSNPYILKVDAAATPEPSDLVLILTGIGAVLLVRRSPAHHKT